MSYTKMTFRVHSGMWSAFSEQIDKLPFHKSKFLDDLIEIETKFLLKDLDGKVLSQAANRYISNHLIKNKKLETTQISVQVRKATAITLQNVVDETNIVRDAFFNRMIMFIRSSDSLLSYLDLPRYQDGLLSQISTGPYAASPLKSLLEIFANPLELIRFGVQERWQTGLYLVDLPEQLIGFTCYLDDSLVPGTEKFDSSVRATEEMLKTFERFEEETFVNPKTERKK